MPASPSGTGCGGNVAPGDHQPPDRPAGVRPYAAVCGPQDGSRAGQSGRGLKGAQAAVWGARWRHPAGVYMAGRCPTAGRGGDVGQGWRRRGGGHEPLYGRQAAPGRGGPPYPRRRGAGPREATLRPVSGGRGAPAAAMTAPPCGHSVSARVSPGPGCASKSVGASGRGGASGRRRAGAGIGAARRASSSRSCASTSSGDRTHPSRGSGSVGAGVGPAPISSRVESGRPARLSRDESAAAMARANSIRCASRRAS